MPDERARLLRMVAEKVRGDLEGETSGSVRAFGATLVNWLVLTAARIDNGQTSWLDDPGSDSKEG